MKCKLLPFLVLSFAPAPAAVAGDDLVLNNAAAREIAQTYGFYLGQTFSWDPIEKKFPELALPSRSARQQFATRFGPSITNMDAMLARKSAEWAKIKADVRANAAKVIADQTITGEAAREFVDIVAKRAKGDIPSPVIETLLTFYPAYVAKPASELTDGFKVRFSADGSGKANGARFHLDYPKSWAAAEDDGPNSLRKFASQNGRGSEIIVVSVKPLPFPAGKKPTDPELVELAKQAATPQGAKEMLPEGATFVGGGAFALGGHPSFYQKYSFKESRAGLSVSVQAVTYTVCGPSALIQIQCLVSRSEAKDEPLRKQRFDKFEPLFKLVASSLVLE